MDAKQEIRAKNAVIEEISLGGMSSFVTIFYDGEKDWQNNRRHENHGQKLTLVISKSTRIKDQFGNPIGVRNLRVGMVVDARFSAAMTKSIPPQAAAYSVSIVKESKSTIIEEGRVVEVGRRRGNEFILTGSPRNPNRQMKYTIGPRTKIRDRWGNPITLRAIRLGQIVRIERESFQTLSIPPQSRAVTVQIVQ